MAKEVAEVRDSGIQIAVIGGGNLWRGETAAEARNGSRSSRLYWNAWNNDERPCYG